MGIFNWMFKKMTGLGKAAGKSVLKGVIAIFLSPITSMTESIKNKVENVTSKVKKIKKIIETVIKVMKNLVKIATKIAGALASCGLVIVIVVAMLFIFYAVVQGWGPYEGDIYIDIAKMQEYNVSDEDRADFEMLSNTNALRESLYKYASDNSFYQVFNLEDMNKEAVYDSQGFFTKLIDGLRGEETDYTNLFASNKGVGDDAYSFIGVYNYDNRYIYSDANKNPATYLKKAEVIGTDTSTDTVNAYYRDYYNREKLFSLSSSFLFQLNNALYLQPNTQETTVYPEAFSKPIHFVNDYRRIQTDSSASDFGQPYVYVTQRVSLDDIRNPNSDFFEHSKLEGLIKTTPSNIVYDYAIQEKNTYKVVNSGDSGDNINYGNASKYATQTISPAYGEPDSAGGVEIVKLYWYVNDDAIDSHMGAEISEDSSSEYFYSNYFDGPYTKMRISGDTITLYDKLEELPDKTYSGYGFTIKLEDNKYPKKHIQSAPLVDGENELQANSRNLFNKVYVQVPSVKESYRNSDEYFARFGEFVEMDKAKYDASKDNEDIMNKCYSITGEYGKGEYFYAEESLKFKDRRCSIMYFYDQNTNTEKVINAFSNFFNGEDASKEIGSKEVYHLLKAYEDYLVDVGHEGKEWKYKYFTATELDEEIFANQFKDNKTLWGLLDDGERIYKTKVEQITSLDAEKTVNSEYTPVAKISGTNSDSTDDANSSNSGWRVYRDVDGSFKIKKVLGEASLELPKYTQSTHIYDSSGSPIYGKITYGENNFAYVWDNDDISENNLTASETNEGNIRNEILNSFIPNVVLPEVSKDLKSIPGVEFDEGAEWMFGDEIYTLSSKEYERDWYNEDEVKFNEKFQDDWNAQIQILKDLTKQSIIDTLSLYKDIFNKTENSNEYEMVAEALFDFCVDQQYIYFPNWQHNSLVSQPCFQIKKSLEGNYEHHVKSEVFDKDNRVMPKSEYTIEELVEIYEDKIAKKEVYDSLASEKVFSDAQNQDLAWNPNVTVYRPATSIEGAKVGDTTTMAESSAEQSGRVTTQNSSDDYLPMEIKSVADYGLGSILTYIEGRKAVFKAGAYMDETYYDEGVKNYFIGEKNDKGEAIKEIEGIDTELAKKGYYPAEALTSFNNTGVSFDEIYKKTPVTTAELDEIAYSLTALQDENSNSDTTNNTSGDYRFEAFTSGNGATISRIKRDDKGEVTETELIEGVTAFSPVKGNSIDELLNPKAYYLSWFNEDEETILSKAVKFFNGGGLSSISTEMAGKIAAGNIGNWEGASNLAKLRQDYFNDYQSVSLFDETQSQQLFLIEAAATFVGDFNYTYKDTLSTIGNFASQSTKVISDVVYANRYYYIKNIAFETELWEKEECEYSTYFYNTEDAAVAQYNEWRYGNGKTGLQGVKGIENEVDEAENRALFKEDSVKTMSGVTYDEEGNETEIHWVEVKYHYYKRSNSKTRTIGSFEDISKALQIWQVKGEITNDMRLQIENAIFVNMKVFSDKVGKRSINGDEYAEVDSFKGSALRGFVTNVGPNDDDREAKIEINKKNIQDTTGTFKLETFISGQCSQLDLNDRKIITDALRYYYNEYSTKYGKADNTRILLDGSDGSPDLKLNIIDRTDEGTPVPLYRLISGSDRQIMPELVEKYFNGHEYNSWMSRLSTTDEKTSEDAKWIEKENDKLQNYLFNYIQNFEAYVPLDVKSDSDLEQRGLEAYKSVLSNENYAIDTSRELLTPILNRINESAGWKTILNESDVSAKSWAQLIAGTIEQNIAYSGERTIMYHNAMNPGDKIPITDYNIAQIKDVLVNSYGYDTYESQHKITVKNNNNENVEIDARFVGPAAIEENPAENMGDIKLGFSADGFEDIALYFNDGESRDDRMNQDSAIKHIVNKLGILMTNKDYDFNTVEKALAAYYWGPSFAKKMMTTGGYDSRAFTTNNSALIKIAITNTTYPDTLNTDYFDYSIVSGTFNYVTDTSDRTKMISLLNITPPSDGNKKTETNSEVRFSESNGLNLYYRDAIAFQNSGIQLYRSSFSIPEHEIYNIMSGSVSWGKGTYENNVRQLSVYDLFSSREDSYAGVGVNAGTFDSAYGEYGESYASTWTVTSTTGQIVKIGEYSYKDSSGNPLPTPRSKFNNMSPVVSMTMPIEGLTTWKTRRAGKGFYPYYSYSTTSIDEHYGIDINGYPIGTPIYAATSGIAYTKHLSGSYGLHVWIDYELPEPVVATASDGDKCTITSVTTYYAHLSKVNIKNGQEVKAGQKIGELGNTGNSSGAHLHFEVRLINKCEISGVIGYGKYAPHTNTVDGWRYLTTQWK